MRFAYLDNFRGFTETTIPLYDVNFLVGENSTGKTSLLKMARLFSTPKLVMGSDFPAGEEVTLGHFGELVSAHATDQTYFRLGMIEDHTYKKSFGAHGVLLTYIQESGQLKIANLTCTIGDKELTIKVEGKKYFYRSDPAAPYKRTQDLPVRLSKWAALHADKKATFREFSPPKMFGSEELPLAVVLSFASSAAPDKASSKRSSFSFHVPHFGPPLIWIAPIRTPPRKTYDEPHTLFSPEGQHTPYVIRRMLASSEEASKFHSFMERVGKSSGLFTRIDLKYFGSKTDPAAPFEVDAYLSGDKPLSLGWLGYGVSQSLPVLVEILDRPKDSWFAIQQPEVHLHPRAQASLGDAFFEMAALDKKRFLIETHSDFTIDRFRMNYRRKRSKTESKDLPTSQVLFFERTGGENVATSIPIDVAGNMSSQQPDSYRDFFVKEQIGLLGG